MPVRIPFKPVDKAAVLKHDRERRGFVTVPLDYADPSAGTIDVLYRVLPPHGSDTDDPTKPYVFVLNGGPGVSANLYRPIDYDYVNNRMPNGEFDRFCFLPASFRIVLIDQRGTDGQSAPIDMEDPSLDARVIGRLFSSDSHARDALAVIDALVPRDSTAPFYIIAQSYGGLPGMQYLAQSGTRPPRGIVFSSSALPFEDPIRAMRERRHEQRRLNDQLRAAVPDIVERLDAVQAHCRAVGADPGIIHGLFLMLGKGVPGYWEPELVKRLDKILGQTKAEIMADVEEGQEGPSLLNYILSSVNFTPGHTDRTLAAMGSREIPLEPWMIDEHEMLMSTGQDGSWKQAFVQGIDDAPPPATPFPTLEAMRAGIARTQALFTVAANDAMVPGDAYRQHVAHFEVPGHTTVVDLPGGHSAIFMEKGHEAFVAWAASLP